MGLPDSVTSALGAQFSMLLQASGEAASSAVRRNLAIFVTSTGRGANAPELAHMLATAAPTTLERRLQHLEMQLGIASSAAEALEVAGGAPKALGLTRGQRTWAQGIAILRSLLGPRALRQTAFPSDRFHSLQDRLAEKHVSLLTYSDHGDPADVQLMGLYQSKGREADATIVVLRDTDYYGREPEPMRTGSKLLYVVLTRARKKTVVLTLGSSLPPLIEPLSQLVREPPSRLR